MLEPEPKVQLNPEAVLEADLNEIRNQIKELVNKKKKKKNPKRKSNVSLQAKKQNSWLISQTKARTNGSRKMTLTIWRTLCSQMPPEAKRDGEETQIATQTRLRNDALKRIGNPPKSRGRGRSNI